MTRFAPHAYRYGAVMDEESDGPYILYVDHKEVIGDMNIKILQLEAEIRMLKHKYEGGPL